MLHLYGPAGWHAVRRLDAADVLRLAAVDAAAGDGPLRAPVPGVVSSVEVVAGDAVTAGTALVVLESMKMYQTLSAPVEARVVEVMCAAGDAVTAGQVLLTLDAGVGA